MLLNKAERVTDIQFVLDDETGRIDCNRWINEANEAVDTKEMERVRPVTDHNEIADQFADCIYVHSYNTRSRLQDNSSTSAQISNSSSSTPLNGYQAAASSHFSMQYSMDGVKGLDKVALDYLQQPSRIYVTDNALSCMEANPFPLSPLQGTAGAVAFPFTLITLSNDITVCKH